MNSQPPESKVKSLYNFFINKNFNKTENLSKTFTKKYPKFQFGWKVLGAIYLQKGLFDKALIANIKSFELVNNDHEAAYNLAINFQNLSKYKEAYKYYTLAIELNSNYPEAFNNRGTILSKQKDLDQAIINYRHAIKLKPNFPEAFYNLANCLKNKKKFKDAIFNYTQAIKLKPRYQEAYSNWLSLIEQESLLTASDDNYKIVSNLLDIDNFVRPREISKLVTALIRNKIDLNSVLDDYLIENITLQDLLMTASNTPLLIKFMSLCPASDIELEKFLKFIRMEILLNFENLTFNNFIKNFQIALANQSFINEFIYYENTEEKNKISELNLKIINKIQNNQEPSIFEILCLASYRPLNTFSWFDDSFYNEELYEIYNRQIYETTKEKKIRDTISSFDNKNNFISSIVKEQYEESPYPRWLNLSLPSSSKSLFKFTNERKLKILNKKIFKISNPKLLIAGCGTGQHSIEMSKAISKCEILAIDLSLNSLSYAKRKTQELNISNIKYIQADILNLDKFSNKFDMIDSVGVLHHMENPLEGWKKLVNLLNDEGLMRIGLYSEIARTHITKTQQEIRKLNINPSPNEMIAFRDDIIKSQEKHHLKLFSTNDFYSLSEFRDLLFNIQEHRFTINQIQNSLDILGLNFCGFENPKLINKFTKKYTNDNDLYDLKLWDQFEQSEKSSFIGMYVFWCQKKI